MAQEEPGTDIRRSQREDGPSGRRGFGIAASEQRKQETKEMSKLALDITHEIETNHVGDSSARYKVSEKVIVTHWHQRSSQGMVSIAKRTRYKKGLVYGASSVLLSTGSTIASLPVVTSAQVGKSFSGQTGMSLTSYCSALE